MTLRYRGKGTRPAGEGSASWGRLREKPDIGAESF